MTRAVEWLIKATGTGPTQPKASNMRIPNDYAIDMIFHSDFSGEKSTETYFIVSSMPTRGEDELHEIVSLKDSGPSSQTYEIIMLSLCGSIFVLAAAAFVVKAVRKRILRLQRHGYPDTLTRDLDAAEMGVAYITTEHHNGDQILTTQATGPLCICYVPEKETRPVEFITLEEKPDSDTGLSFSFTSSITQLDVPQRSDRPRLHSTL